MNTKLKKNLIGVAWPYVNGDLHPGHIAGCYLPADIFARFKRLRGEEVLMVSGCDCFGTPITIQADKEGVTPKDIVEKYAPKATSLLLDTYQISFDSFTKTDTDLHREITQQFFMNLANNGYIIKKSSAQYYSETDNKFLPDRYVEGECSFCHAKEQRGDQCENCGRSLQVGELINPYAKLTKNPVSLKETEHYFVDLSQFKEELTQYISEKEGKWRTWVWKEAKAWIEELQPRAITRDIDWGVEIPQEGIPDDLKIQGAENKRFYVWFDAVIGYFSEGVKVALGDGDGDPAQARDRLISSPKVQEFLNKFWRSDDENLEHYLFVGKDNLFFHTLWWQSLLLGQSKLSSNVIPDEATAKIRNLGSFKLKLADNVPVNQFLNLEGQKFSKSRNIYIDSVKLVEEFGLDSVRFYLASIMPENADANWKWEDFQVTINNELVANIGNFIHRTLTFAVNKLALNSEKFSTSKVYLDEIVLDKLTQIAAEYTSAINSCEFSKALNIVLDLGKFANKYFNDKKPWKVLNESKDGCEYILINCIQIVSALRVLLNPFLPDASDRLSDLLGLEKINSSSTNRECYIFNIDYLETQGIKISNELKPLFAKIEAEQIEKFNS